MEGKGDDGKVLPANRLRAQLPVESLIARCSITSRMEGAGAREAGSSGAWIDWYLAFMSLLPPIIIICLHYHQNLELHAMEAHTSPCIER